MLRSESVEQMIQLLVRFREKYRRNYNTDRAHNEAIEDVAAKWKVTSNTIRDMCFRRLDLSSVNKFRDLLEKWMLGDPEPLRRLLKLFIPGTFHVELDAILSEETGVAIAKQKSDTAAGRVYRRLDENFTVCLDPESAKKVKVLALMKDMSAEDWLSESALKLLEQEYTAWLKSERENVEQTGDEGVKMGDVIQLKKVRELYSELVDSQFSFMGKGEFHIQKIYSAVEKRYPHLCDDSLMCRWCCKGSKDTGPEWKHRVRTVLGLLKDNGEVKKENNRGCWIFYK